MFIVTLFIMVKLQKHQSFVNGVGDGPLFMSIGCFSKGSRFNSQYAYGSSHLSISSLTVTDTSHTLTCRQNVSENKIKKKIKFIFAQSTPG